MENHSLDSIHADVGFHHLLLFGAYSRLPKGSSPGHAENLGWIGIAISRLTRIIDLLHSQKS